MINRDDQPSALPCSNGDLEFGHMFKPFFVVDYIAAEGAKDTLTQISHNNFA